MRQTEARITKVSLDPGGQIFAWLECSPETVPEPGRYCLATSPEERNLAVPVVIFAGDVSETGFKAVGDLPGAWLPGASIRIRGPLGQGFKLPATLRRLALAACGMTAARLLPLAQKAAQQGADIAWFTDVPLPVLPAAYELNPLKALPDSVGWADFLALDLPLALLPKLRELLGQTEEPAGYNLACPGQALIYTSMPCGGVAECGVCAVPMRHGWKLACQDGPVFALNRLAW